MGASWLHQLLLQTEGTASGELLFSCLCSAAWAKLLIEQKLASAAFYARRPRVRFLTTDCILFVRRAERLAKERGVCACIAAAPPPTRRGVAALLSFAEARRRFAAETEAACALLRRTRPSSASKRERLEEGQPERLDRR